MPPLCVWQYLSYYIRFCRKPQRGRPAPTGIFHRLRLDKNCRNTVRFDAAPRPGGNMEKGGDPPKPAWRRPLQGMKRLSREFGQPAAEGRKTFVKPDAGRGVLPVFSRQNIFRCGILPPWQAVWQKKKTGPTVRVGPALMRYFYPVCEEGKPPGLVQHAVPVSYTHLDVYKRQGCGSL